MKRKTINYSTSFVLTILFFIVGLLGILIFPGFLKIFGINLNSLPKLQMSNIHHTIGVIVIISISVHVVLHWNWMGALIKKFFSPAKKKGKSTLLLASFIINIILLIASILLIITGIIKYPGLLNVENTPIPLNEISFIHEWSGIVVFSLVIVHLIFFLKKVISSKKSN